MNLSQLGEDSQWRAASAFDLHWDCKDRCALGRQTIQSRDILEDRHIGSAEYLMSDEIARRPVIDTWGIYANGLDRALLHEKLRGLF